MIISLLVLLSACDDTFERTPSFDGPSAATVLDSQEMGPFDEPIGFVANARNGRIVPLDLKHATLFSDQVAAPFIRPRWIATGSERRLSDLLAWSPTEQQVTIYASDTANGVLIEAPYVLGMEPNPIIAEASHSDPTFDDRDGSGNTATMQNIVLTNGWTTTETWTLEYDGTDWSVEGSASGLQPNRARFGTRFKSEHHEIAFTLTGNASRGDRITIETDTGITEHDLGGTILALARVPGQPMMALSVYEPATEQNSISLWDLDENVEIGRFELPEGAQAWRFAFGESAAELYVADARNPQFFEVLLNIDEPSNSEYLAVAAAGPLADIAWVSDSLSNAEAVLEDADTGDLFDDPSINRDYEHLFVAVAGESRVDVYDLQADDWIDVNPLDAVTGGIDLGSPVVGLDASTERVYLPERNDLDRRVEGKVVAVSTYGGSLLLLNGETGCAATDYQGPHVPITQGFESVQFTDVGRPSSPSMLVDDATGRRVQASRCGGVLRTEMWTVTFDELAGNWEVEGSISGMQVQRAYDDQRYVSDNGAISFTVNAGTTASSDGDNFTFYTDEGILRIDRVQRTGSVQAEALELPAAPVLFEYRTGRTDGGWDKRNQRAMIMLPVMNSDLVLRVRVKRWDVEAIWN